MTAVEINIAEQLIREKNSWLQPDILKEMEQNLEDSV
jgi:hypothetical protein